METLLTVLLLIVGTGVIGTLGKLAFSKYKAFALKTENKVDDFPLRFEEQIEKAIDAITPKVAGILREKLNEIQKKDDKKE